MLGPHVLNQIKKKEKTHRKITALYRYLLHNTEDRLSYLLRSKMLSTRLLNYTNPNCWKRKTMASSKEVDLENYDNTSTSKMVLTPRKVQSSRSKCKNCITLVFSSIGVVFLLLSYIICGAIVFSNIEGNYSRHRGKTIYLITTRCACKKYVRRSKYKKALL